MFNKLFIIIISLLALSCNNNTSKSNISKISPKDIHFDGKNFVINTAASGNHQVKFSICNQPFETKMFDGNLNINLQNFIQSSNVDKYLIAYESVINNGIPTRIVLDSELDTTLLVSFKDNVQNEFNANVISGTCSRLMPKREANKIDKSSVVKWLFKNSKKLSDEDIDKMHTQILKIMFNGKDNLYLPQSDKKIPVIKSFANKTYKLNSNLEADYYYLFAARKISEIDDFVAEVISENFPNANKSKSSNFSCFRASNASGLLVMCLVGINSDWTKQYIPVGIVSIDLDAPQLLTSSTLFNFEGVKECNFNFGNFLITVPEKLQTETKGRIIIETEEFRGSDAAFCINWTGDVKSVAIKRIARNSWDYSTETKVINLTDKKSPFHFRYNLNLPLGKNYIPIFAYDNNGNKTESELLIKMVPVEDNNPDINIDNNIDIYN